MIEASPTLAFPPLSATLVRRRRPMRFAPPAPHAARHAILAAAGIEPATPRWPSWKQDLRFFLGCYAAGLVFFVVMLS